MILCSPSCGIAPHSRSGGEVLERELVRALRRGGDDPHVLLARHQTTDPRDERLVERLRWGRGLRGAFLLAAAMAPAIRRCYRAHRFDALRAHSAKHLGLACQLSGHPWVAHIQHVDRPHPVEMWALHKAAHVITISEFSRRQVEAYGIPRERITVIPPGVDHTAFYRKHYVVGRPASGRLLFVGGLKARKRPLMLLDILEHVPGATLTVVGDGPLRVPFLHEVERRGLAQRVRLYTNVCDAQRVSFYRAADVFLFPSALEGFGMPVLEAMACGLPVVASDEGALPELVSSWLGREASVRGARDYPAFYAERVRYLLDHPDFARATGERNYQRSQAYTWVHTARLVRRVCGEVRG